MPERLSLIVQGGQARTQSACSQSGAMTSVDLHGLCSLSQTLCSPCLWVVACDEIGGDMPFAMTQAWSLFYDAVAALLELSNTVFSLFYLLNCSKTSIPTITASPTAQSSSSTTCVPETDKTSLRGQNCRSNNYGIFSRRRRSVPSHRCRGPTRILEGDPGYDTRRNPH
jgi:hypothetical protein